MQLAFLQIGFIILLIYFFGKFFTYILISTKFLDRSYDTLTIKFLISLLIINSLVIYGVNLINISKLTFLISFISLIYFINQELNSKRKLHFNKIFFNTSNLFIFITLIFFLIKIIIEPVQLWDARSIWFYSGKIIYFNEGYLFEKFQNDFCYKCDYLLYPKFIPSLTAYVATIFGFWNDYVTKLSLFLLLIPAIFFLREEFNDTLNFFLSLILLIFSLGFFIWNGYADGYLAIYTSISYLCFLKFIQTQKNYYFFMFFISLSIIINLKIESFFFILSIFSFLLLTKNFLFLKKIFQKQNIFVLYLIFIPILLWWLITLTNFSQIKVNSNIYSLSFFEYLESLVVEKKVLGSRFKNYLIFVISFVFIESKIIYAFLLQFLIILYSKFLKLEIKNKLEIINLNIIPLIYALIITIFYLYIGYTRSLNGMENMIIASFDRLTLAVKSLFAVNILFILNSYKLNLNKQKTN